MLKTILDYGLVFEYFCKAMKELNKYISDLLIVHDCVIIPGFGGFIGNYNSALINEKTHFFIPPSKAILFNKNLVSNDGLLINHISQEENISYIEAKLNLQKFVEQLYNTLDIGKTVLLNDIGELKLDNYKNILFEPYGSKNLLIDSFGLFNFSFPQLEELSNNIINKNFTNPKRKKTSYAKLVIIPLAIALFMTPFKSNIIESFKDNAGIIKDSNISLSTSSIGETLDYLTNKEIALLYTENSKINSIDTSTVVEQEKNVDNKKIETAQNIIESDLFDLEFKDGNSYIIVGCFKEYANAEVLVTSLKTKGINASIYSDKGYSKVSIGQFSNRELANIELQKIRKIDNSIQSWVMSK